MIYSVQVTISFIVQYSKKYDLGCIIWTKVNSNRKNNIESKNIPACMCMMIKKKIESIIVQFFRCEYNKYGIAIHTK